MADQDFSIRTFNDDHRQFDPRTPYAGDDTLGVKFYIGAKLDEGASLREGREVYVDVELIRIFVTKDEIVVSEVDEMHRRRWPRQYAAWKSTGNNEPGMGGTPLDRLIGITPAQIAELKYQQIHSIERLIDAPEGVLMRAPGLMALKAKAVNYMRVSRETAPIAAAAEAMERMKAMEESVARIEAVVARNKDLERQVAEMSSRIAAAPTPLPPVRHKRKYTKRASP